MVSPSKTTFPFKDTIVIWGSLYVASKTALADLSPTALLFFRYFLGLFPLFVLYRREKKQTRIRRGDWKLVYYYEDGRRELFNIRRDIGEREELSASEPRRVRELSRRLGRFLRRVGAQRPSFKATGEPCPWPDEIDTKAPGGR